MHTEDYILIALVIVIILILASFVDNYCYVERMKPEKRKGHNVTYSVTFMSKWGLDPRINHPSNPHTGNMFLVSHDNNFELFALGKLASKGVKQTSMYGTLDDLFAITNNNKHIGNIVTAGVLETPGE